MQDGATYAISKPRGTIDLNLNPVAFLRDN